MHVGNLFYTEPGLRLAQRLSERSLGGKVHFANSGTEANEAALKVARKAKPGGTIVSVHRAFHGRTYGSLSATPQESKQAPVRPARPRIRGRPADRRGRAPARSTSAPRRCCSSRCRARAASTSSTTSCCGPRVRPATSTAPR